MHCDAMLPSGYENSGGGNKYSRNIISMLISEKISFLYFTEQTDDTLETSGNLGTEAYFYRIRLQDSSTKKGTIAYFQKAIEIIESILHSYRTCEFVFHSIYWNSGIIAEYFSKKYTSYYIHTVISNEQSKIAQAANDINARKRCAIEQFTFEKARYIICSSESEAADIAKYYGINSDKIIVTGRFIEKEFLYPYQDIHGNPQINSLSTKTPIQYVKNAITETGRSTEHKWQSMNAFIYIGRIHKNKGISYIIEAWSCLYHKYKELVPPLWIVGGTPNEIDFFKEKFIKDKNTLQKTEQEYKLIWWGVCSPSGISTLMTRCHALIAHSKYEAGGNVILEAMAHSLPVIATPFGYARDYIRHGENGYLVPYKDIATLAKYMEHFIRQPYLSNYMGRIANNDLKEIISGWHFYDKHMKMYGYQGKSQQYFMEKDIVPPDSISTYFDPLIMPDKQFIYDLITLHTKHQIVSISGMENMHNYYLWEVVTTNCKFYFYYLYSILDRGCLIEKKEKYIITKRERIYRLKENCKTNDVAVFFIDAGNGMAYLEQRMEIDL